MFTSHWNLKEIEVKDRLFKSGYILTKNHEDHTYVVLKLDSLDNSTEIELTTDILDECLSLI